MTVKNGAFQTTLTSRKARLAVFCLFSLQKGKSNLHDHDLRNVGGTSQKGMQKDWKYKEYNEMLIGERVQVDHMSASKTGVTVKHFQAWDRRSKHIHAQIHSYARARSAKRFLEELVKTAPYKIRSIQVEGGSEFMAEFETECERLAIPLIVLPPSRPKYNGGVERGNRTFRQDFYDGPAILADSIGALRFDLKKAITKYNTYCPHHTLQGSTLIEYLRITKVEVESLKLKLHESNLA